MALQEHGEAMDDQYRKGGEKRSSVKPGTSSGWILLMDAPDAAAAAALAAPVGCGETAAWETDIDIHQRFAFGRAPALRSGYRLNTAIA